MSCTLYLMRHGIAADAGPQTNDAERALTEEGTGKTTRAAHGLKRLGVSPQFVLSSPLRRAEETAQLAAAVVAPRVTVEIFPPLSPGHDPRELIQGLRAYRTASEILLVGHQPDLGELASFLLTGSSGLAPLPFKKAGTAAILVGSLPPRTAGSLQWFLTPGQLRAIGRASGKEVD
jgi:phosphohistidine phosphatase